jgi:hypothetical protein
MCRLAAVAAADEEAEDTEAAGADADAEEDFDSDDREEAAPLAAAADVYLGAFCFQCGTGFFAASEATPPSSRLTFDAAAALPSTTPKPALIPALALRPGAETEAATLASASRAR